jgi:hypothetical protein
MAVKASYDKGFKSAEAWGFPCTIKCLFKDIRSALTPSLPLREIKIDVVYLG